jgi:hypothetical protein
MNKPLARYLLVVGAIGIVAWQIFPFTEQVKKSREATEKRLELERCSAYPEDMERWKIITGSDAAAMNLANAMKNICMTGTPRWDAVEAVNALVMARRRL